ncbi:hypothetical protein [Patulibacter sp.]|uniref:hypothetical protein n=1 Tax=Patulibacter sp. TaxID=1912859 RepID=UPI00271D7A2D|nr:hypothetical protein [Patulibacter sp.]MDO9409559.1 hypothetical protein [Patulibacter sp.]
MKQHLLKASIVATLSAVAFTGCGGDDGGEGGGGGDEFAAFTTQDVQQRFKELAGIDLRVMGSSGQGTDTLSLPSGGTDSTRIRQRYGSFLITVSNDEESFKRRREFASSTGTEKVVKNVVLRGIGSDDVEFQRVARIVGSLGTPVAQVRLAPEDTPCSKLGIDPDGGTGKTGTCLDRQQTVTVVDAKGPLELPLATVGSLDQKIGRTLTSKRFGTTRRVRAQGAFVAVRVKIENTSDAPLTGLRPDLVINGRRYGADTRNGYYLDSDAFPMQPGATARATFLFDVPRTADDPREGGALEFASDGESYTSPENAGVVGRIRLSPGTGSTSGDASR